MNYDLLNGADLAFIGDACYELYIRKHVLDKGVTKLLDLHKSSVKYVSKTAQARIIKALLPELSIEEVEVYKRGRNYKYKKVDTEYINASGFEAVIGYLYLKNNVERMEILISKAIEIIEME